MSSSCSVLKIANPNPLTSCWVSVVLPCPFINFHFVSLLVMLFRFVSSRIRVRILSTLTLPVQFFVLSDRAIFVFRVKNRWPQPLTSCPVCVVFSCRVISKIPTPKPSLKKRKIYPYTPLTVETPFELHFQTLIAFVLRTKLGV